MKYSKLLVFIFCITLVHLIYAQASPIPMLEEIANKIITTLKENKTHLKNDPTIIQNAVQRYLLPYIDVSGMSRSVLGRQIWQQTSSSERQQFSKEFTQLVIRTYARPLTEYTDETIKFLPIKTSLDNKFLRVNSIIIRSRGQNIALNYSLVAKNDTWKIYDFSVEGISLLQSFRSQFASALKQSSMQEIIQKLRQSSQKVG